MAKTKTPTEPETTVTETKPVTSPVAAEPALDLTELAIEAHELIYRCAHSLLKAASPTKNQCFKWLERSRTQLGTKVTLLEESWRK